MTLMRIVIFAFAVLASLAPGARANPWSQGISEDTQAQANKIFAEANQLAGQQAHAAAVDKYKEAVALWDHPMIQYNMAHALIRLDRVLEAAVALEAALRYGATPFTPALYEQATAYQQLIAGRVGTIEVSCTQPTAQVLLDGKPWFECPGTKSLQVLAGEHSVVVEARDYMTSSRRVIVTGSNTARESVELVPIDAMVKLEYPRPRWIPWTIAGLGAGVGFGGLGFWFAGKNQMDRFEASFAQACPTGCMADLADEPALRDQRDSAQLKGKIAVTMMITGGVMAVTGVVWGGFINRPRRLLPVTDVMPTPGGAVASATWQF
jgi:hypothetical protein